MRPDVTALLQAAGDDAGSTAKLFEVVYADLRVIAEAQMRAERAGHTLQATALVSEAYLRLVGPTPVRFEDRKHFFRVAAEAMRRILIDHARAKKSQKRGGGRAREALMDDHGALSVEPERLLALDEALSRLEMEDERAAEIVRLRFFAGLGIDQVAELTGVSRRTAIRDWNFARARLSELMGGDEA